MATSSLVHSPPGGLCRLPDTHVCCRGGAASVHPRRIPSPPCPDARVCVAPRACSADGQRGRLRPVPRHLAQERVEGAGQAAQGESPHPAGPPACVPRVCAASWGIVTCVPRVCAASGGIVACVQRLCLACVPRMCAASWGIVACVPRMCAASWGIVACELLVMGSA